MILKEKKLWYYVYLEEAKIVIKLSKISSEIEQGRKDKVLTLFVLLLKNNVFLIMF